MSQLIDNTNTIISTATALTNNTAATLSTEIDFRKCIGGIAQIDFQFATAPTADTTLDLYLLPALASGTDYDVYSQGQNIFLGSVTVGAVTTAQRLSVPLAAVNCPYGKLAIYNNATGQTVTINSLKVVVRKVG